MAIRPQGSITLLLVSEQPPDPRSDRRLLWRAALCAVLVTLMTAGTTVAAVLLQVKDVIAIVQQGQPAIPRIHSALDDVAAGKPQTILLLGSDHRFAYDTLGASNQANSDTMILVHLDPNENATTVLSIPRDLQVTIPGHGTAKINAAFAEGGPVLAAKTVRALLGVKINHVFVTTFTAFSRAVDFIGCVYSEVDHRYYVPPESGYAAIDLQPGYQRLCGAAALSFVRFRHSDNDLVRAARQQAFLRSAGQQVRVSGLIGKAKQLVRVLANYTQTDVRSSLSLLRLLKLAVLSASHPVVQVAFPATFPQDPKDTFVYSDPVTLQAAVHKFLHPPAPRKPKPTRRHHRKGSTSSRSAVQLVAAPGQRAAGKALRRKAHFGVYHLSGLIRGSSPASAGTPRAYQIKDLSGKRHNAYRWTFATGEPGEYYGLQGTTWSDPPILQEATGTIRIRGRTALVATSGGKVLWIGWRRGRSVHWVSNTLTQTLTSKEMVALAEAARL
ncbi:MAG: polyisoprenyl-teichoic acid--peptidoglycan teichoic acid transferase [Solirubrobacteraceae bacterium]|jgi:LCP family protein required for cell wall assembly|nr:polyisoprenyl-teichoic acid--peptidoglycan teichoic acid transferase [Solirubrobacteraceae bacterium]